MENWWLMISEDNVCRIQLTVNGDMSNMNAFFQASLPGFSFDKLIPVPSNLETLDQRRQWKRLHWGSPTDVMDFRCRTIEPQTMTFSFCCYQTPPIDGLKAVASRFPQLTFIMGYVNTAQKFYGFVALGPGATNRTVESSFDNPLDNDLLSHLECFPYLKVDQCS